MPRMVKITHPELGESTIVESSFRVWEKKGWSLVDEEVEDPEPESEDDVYDGHTVSGVSDTDEE